ncbi:MAG: hypothetical protein CVU44_12420 [Chloroflexi bacterium HGW-Chloroflexi-6]|nr:MAG: hypothetical protein CVU44_12420 [Chloroflexi bacterium HGW-Chloroflexi-6]
MILILAITAIVLVGCAGNTTEQTQAPPTPNTTRTPRPTQTRLPQTTSRPTVTISPSITPAPSVTAFSINDPAPMKISFQTPDGVTLRGYFYPAARSNAPVVVMMHQNEGNQSLWWAENSGFIPWLQNWQPQNGEQPTPSANGALPLLNPTLTFNVLTFDFRGHGESGGERPQDSNIFLIDARAAYQAARSLPGVDANRIAGIGTSIGADAVINACDETCRGAFAISPGSWLGVDYTQSAQKLIEKGKPVRCMYAVNDGPSPATCWSIAPGEQYQIFAYAGVKHGMTFFVPRKMEADFGKNIIEFLIEATK